MKKLDSSASIQPSASPIPPAQPELKTNHPRQGSAAATIQLAIDDLFLNEGHAKKALADNLKPRAIDAWAIRERADVAFKSFTASKHQSEDRLKPTYAEPGHEPAPKVVETIILTGLTLLSGPSHSRTLRVRETDAFLKLIDPATANRDSIGTVALADLLAFIEDRLDVLPSERPCTVISPCEIEEEVEQWLRSLEQGGDDHVMAPADQTGGGGSQSGEERQPSSDADAKALVDRQVALLMAKVAAPEEQLRFEVPGRQQRADLARALETFELRAGPSDVTSYHDFNSLQIAFQHVWTEIFDGQLAPLGKELYCEYVKLKTSLGIDNGSDRTIDTLHDLAQLMSEIRDLSIIKTADLPSSLQPPGGEGGAGGMSAGDIVNTLKQGTLGGMVASATGNEAAGFFADPAGWSIGKIAQWLAGKPTLTWDDFEIADTGVKKPPLPMEGDRIQVRFEANEVPSGQVEIVIANTEATRWWKGIEFVEFSPDGKILSTKRVATDKENVKEWNPSKTDRLQIATTKLRTGALEFLKEAPRVIGGFATGFYRLTGLDSRIEDRMRVTFTWVQD